MIVMDYFTKWPEVYTIHNQEASTVTNFFCRFGIPRELHSDRGSNFESRVLQVVLRRLGLRNYLRVRFPIRLLDFSVDYGPEVDSASNRNEYQESSRW
jgi:hypothetical protein